ncbi:MAG: 2OG-Fe(II) oxygenase [Roseiarcus sp.]
MDMPLLMRDRVVSPAGSHLRHAVVTAQRTDWPFRHWSLRCVLPAELCTAVAALPFTPPPIGDTQGKRETHNASRLFVSPVNQRRFGACAVLAEAFQDEATTALLEDMCDVELGGSFLRIEYCLDTDGFWLAQHTDIGAKLFTMLIYLSDQPGSQAWGTDILDADMKLVETAPYRRNGGLIFIPAADTWHGFHRRAIEGVRRSLIVNYVRNEWRSRHELAFPRSPIGG